MMTLKSIQDARISGRLIAPEKMATKESAYFCRPQLIRSAWLSTLLIAVASAVLFAPSQAQAQLADVDLSLSDDGIIITSRDTDEYIYVTFETWPAGSVDPVALIPADPTIVLQVWVDDGTGAKKVFGAGINITTEDDLERIALDSAEELQIFAMGGNDWIETRLIGVESDVAMVFRGGDGNDVLLGGSGEDVLDGGPGNDHLDGGEGDDKGEEGVPGLDGGPGDDYLFGGGGSDVIWGGSGNDVIQTGKGDDEALGDDGYDVADYRFANGVEADLSKVPQTVSKKAPVDGSDKLFGFEVFRGSSKGDTITGATGGSNTILGGGGGDTIVGGPYADLLFGETGNDRISSVDGDPDIMIGGSGNDTITGTSKADTLIGDGFEFERSQIGGHVTYDQPFIRLVPHPLEARAGRPVGSVLILDDSPVGSMNPGTGVLNIRNLVQGYGSSEAAYLNNDYLLPARDGMPNSLGEIDIVPGNDVINGGDKEDRIAGGGGDDTLNGQNHSDLIFGDHVPNRPQALASFGNWGPWPCLQADVTLSWPFYGDDKIKGEAKADTIIGGGGSDRINGDELGASSVNSGSDRIFGDYYYDANDIATYNVIVRYAGNMPHNDTIFGGNHPDTIYGGPGNDHLIGGPGDDTFYPNSGSDHIYGGQILAHDPNERFDENGFIKEFESVDVDADQHDFLSYSYVQPAVPANPGDATGTGVYVDLGANMQCNGQASGTGGLTGTSMGDGENGVDYIYGIEDLNGSVNDDVLIGSLIDNTIRGLSGHDLILGRRGDDWLYGDAGDDVIWGDNGTDRPVDERTGGGATNADWIEGGDGDDQLHGEWGDDVIRGDRGNDFLCGGGDEDILNYYTTYVGSGWGGSGVVINLWDANQDLTVLGDLAKRYDLPFDPIDDRADLPGGTLVFPGDDPEQLDGTYCAPGVVQCYSTATDDYGDFDTIANNRTLRFTLADGSEVVGVDRFEIIAGSRGNDVIWGNRILSTELWGFEGNDFLVGGIADDKLDGGSGSDFLEGRAGDDDIIGGPNPPTPPGIQNETEHDYVSYDDVTAPVDTPAGPKGIVVNLGESEPQDTRVAGMDRLTDIENVIGTDFDDIIKGNYRENRLYGGDGNDLLVGRADEDVYQDVLWYIKLDVLNGGPGLDTADYRLSNPSAIASSLETVLATTPNCFTDDTVDCEIENDGEGGSDRLVKIEGILEPDQELAVTLADDKVISPGESVMLEWSATGGNPTYKAVFDPATDIREPEEDDEDDDESPFTLPPEVVTIVTPSEITGLTFGQQFTVKASPLKTTLYRVTVTDSQDPADQVGDDPAPRVATGFATVTVADELEVTIDQEEYIIGEGQTIQLMGRVSGGITPYTVTWKADDDSQSTTLSATNILIPIAKPAKTTVYTLTVTDSAPDSAPQEVSAETTVTVIPNGNAASTSGSGTGGTSGTGVNASTNADSGADTGAGNSGEADEGLTLGTEPAGDPQPAVVPPFCGFGLSSGFVMLNLLLLATMRRRRWVG